MERRRLRRKVVRLNAERISGNKHHAVFIESISKNGMNIITAPANNAKYFSPDKPFELRFQLPTKETFTLQCIVKWSY